MRPSHFACHDRSLGSRKRIAVMISVILPTRIAECVKWLCSIFTWNHTSMYGLTNSRNPNVNISNPRTSESLVFARRDNRLLSLLTVPPILNDRRRTRLLPGQLRPGERVGACAAPDL